MEKMFGPAYTGDPGVPHSDKEAFGSIFWGSVAFSAYSIACPYYWEQCNNMFKWVSVFTLFLDVLCFLVDFECFPGGGFRGLCVYIALTMSLDDVYRSWHDLAMVHEQHHWKRAQKKGKDYEFKVSSLHFLANFGRVLGCRELSRWLTRWLP